MADKLPPAQRGVRWYLTVLTQNFPDWVGLNFLFLLTCLPTVTLGPALSAMGQVALQMANDQPTRPVRAYLSFFRRDFLRKAGWGLLFLVLNVLLFTAIWFYFALGGLFVALTGTALAGLILLWGIGLHLFPALDQGQTLRGAWLDFLTSLPKSVLAVALALIAIAAQLLLFPAVVPLTLTVGAVLPALILVFPRREPPIE